ncbi:Uu.00g138840.m01.CDS01 [Anthostomella pinea]|uniref:Uu.00g138840.m01.CDS01 n=1 Tax=Anthostomella pinea TaxID=933095 RepID=A0AAI8VPS4_9PEZI|nr:Uu.00g138840.m01.CDS01 [Anthostomella pinea]
MATSRDIYSSKGGPSSKSITDHIRDIFTGRDEPPDRRGNRNPKGKMSRSQSQPTTFADIAVSYRVYILDDLLAEPQEIVHDWYRNLLYVCQRHRQGNAFAPVELGQEISVLDLSVGDIVSSIDITPYTGPHCLELADSCAYLHGCVDGGSIWVDPETRALSNFEPLEKRRRATRTSEDFIAEIDLRSGKMRQRVNMPEQNDRNATDGRHVAFSAPGLRFASRSSSSGLPVVDVSADPIIEVIKAKFAVRTIYVTSRNVMLV